MIVIFLLASQPVSVRPQTPRSQPAVLPLSAGQFCRQFASAHSFAANPAVFPGPEGFSAAGYAGRKYMIEGLNDLFIAAAFNRSSSVAGLSVLYSGDADYSETQVGLNYGKKLGKLTMGALFRYNRTALRGAAPSGSFQFGIATVWSLSEKVFTSVQITNPPLINTKKDRHAAVYRFGIAYSASGKLYLGFEFIKEESWSPEAVGLIRYRFAGDFLFSAGIYTGSTQPFTGINWRRKNFEFGVMVMYHTILGASPGILIIPGQRREE